MTTGRLIGRLRALKLKVLEDGKIDWDETDQLLEAVRPLAVKRGFLFEDFARLLEKCREDGEIDPEESKQIAMHLEFLCTLYANRRIRFWLIALLGILIAAASLALLHGVIAATGPAAAGAAQSVPGDI